MKQSRCCGHSRPRHCSLVAVRSFQKRRSSGRSSISARSPVSVAAAHSVMRASHVRSSIGQTLLDGLHGGETVPAQVVRPALHVRRADLAAQRACERRQILVEHLVLEGARAGRDQHAFAGKDRRDEIRECLAGARPGFGDQGAARGERPCDFRRQLLLTGTRLVPVERDGERAVFRKGLFDPIGQRSVWHSNEEVGAGSAVSAAARHVRPVSLPSTPDTADASGRSQAHPPSPREPPPHRRAPRGPVR